MPPQSRWIEPCVTVSECDACEMSVSVAWPLVWVERHVTEAWLSSWVELAGLRRITMGKEHAVTACLYISPIWKGKGNKRADTEALPCHFLWIQKATVYAKKPFLGSKKLERAEEVD